MCGDDSNQGQNNLSLPCILFLLIVGVIVGVIVEVIVGVIVRGIAGVIVRGIVVGIIAVVVGGIVVGQVKPLGVLVGLAELFILTIVIALFANKFTGYSIIIPILNSPTISLTSAFLFVVSIITSILTGFVINQRLEAREQVVIEEENISKNIKQVWDDIYLPEDSKEDIERKIKKYNSKIKELEQKCQQLEE